MTLSKDPASVCSVLVPSCDAYSDLWRPFFTQFWTHWPDCPFPVYLGSNQQTFSHERVTTIRADHGTNWANRVREQIAALPTPYVLLFLEDFFLRSRVDTKQVTACLEALTRLDGRMVRLVKRPGPDRPLEGVPMLGEIEPGAPYRVSTQTAIWSKQALLDLMRPDESIWQFELDGSRRSDSLPGFFGVWRDVMTYKHHVVERGKWFRDEARRFGGMGIGCDFSRRPVMTPMESASWNIRKAFGVLTGCIPWKARRKLGIIRRG